jgi:hypothetical protein
VPNSIPENSWRLSSDTDKLANARIEERQALARKRKARAYRQTPQEEIHRLEFGCVGKCRSVATRTPEEFACQHDPSAQGRQIKARGESAL